MSSLSISNGESSFEWSIDVERESSSNVELLNNCSKSESWSIKLNALLKKNSSKFSNNNDFDSGSSGLRVENRSLVVTARQVAKISLRDRVRRICSVISCVRLSAQQRTSLQKNSLFSSLLNFCKHHTFVSLLILSVFACSIALTAGASVGLSVLAFSPLAFYLLGNLWGGMRESAVVSRYFSDQNKNNNHLGENLELREDCFDDDIYSQSVSNSKSNFSLFDYEIGSQSGSEKSSSSLGDSEEEDLSSISSVSADIFESSFRSGSGWV